MINETTRKISLTLIEFYDTMKGLEKIDERQEREGKKAAKLIMTTNDIEDILAKELEQWKIKSNAIERDYAILEKRLQDFKDNAKHTGAQAGN